MSISLRLSEEESLLIKSYAKVHGISVSELFRRSVIERIEDDYDLQLYEKAMSQHKKNPKTYTHEEVKKLLEID